MLNVGTEILANRFIYLIDKLKSYIWCTLIVLSALK